MESALGQEPGYNGGIRSRVKNESKEAIELREPAREKSMAEGSDNHKMGNLKGGKETTSNATASEAKRSKEKDMPIREEDKKLEGTQPRKESLENPSSMRNTDIEDIEIPPISAESRSTTAKTLIATPTLPSESETTTPSDPKEISTTQPWTSNSSTFTLSKNKKKWASVNENSLKNSLLAGVGFLELANAGDFAANVWNEIPVPKFAAVLMGIGGVFALWISIFAFMDIRLARRNYVLLKRERKLLKERDESKERNTYLAVNFRELGTEIIDRICMDAFMGFGAVMVGVGTLLAIGGANPRVYHASNLLSGYIGNSPVALFGLFNAFWSLFIIIRAEHHRHYARKALTSTIEKEVLKLLNRRTRRVQSHAAIMGLVGLIGGGASLVTSEHWEGYPILIPCIIFSAYCNWVWRTRVGYSRPCNDSISSPISDMARDALVEEVGINAALLKACRGSQKTVILEKMVEESDSMVSILEFLARYGLFTSFCLKILKDGTLTKSVFGITLEEKKEIEISPEDFLIWRGKVCFVALKDVAEGVVKEGIEERLRHRERFLLEALGCYLVEVKRRRKSEKRGRGNVELGEK